MTPKQMDSFIVFHRWAPHAPAFHNGEAAMLTSALCRAYAKRSRALGKSAHISPKRRTQAMSMAQKWTALAEGIDRDEAKLASRGILKR